MRFSNVLKVRLVTSVISNAGTHVIARGFPDSLASPDSVVSFSAC